MTDKAKVMLSEFEAMLIKNRDWILTKHVIIEKAGELLGSQVHPINLQFIRPLLPVLPRLASCSPKLSKGEKYQGLPYVILDHPAMFSRTDVFALRTMFWWGNFISVTLHLSGTHKRALENLLIDRVKADRKDLYISTGESEWEHHFAKSNFTPVEEMEAEMLYKKIVQPSFIKIALQYDLSEWDNMNELLQVAYSRLAGLIKA